MPNIQVKKPEAEDPHVSFMLNLSDSGFDQGKPITVSVDVKVMAQPGGVYSGDPNNNNNPYTGTKNFPIWSNTEDMAVDVKFNETPTAYGNDCHVEFKITLTQGDTTISTSDPDITIALDTTVNKGISQTRDINTGYIKGVYATQGLKIGSTVFGGIVFSWDSVNEQGLVVASADQPSNNWQGEKDKIVEINTNWYLGYNDWRLPTKTELGTVYNLQKVNNTNNCGQFGNFWYWSSEEDPNNINNAWVQSFFDGEYRSYPKTNTNPRFRPIRAF